MGQVYVMFSRVTDPRHLQLIGRRLNRCRKSRPCVVTVPYLAGLPPDDIVADVVDAWAKAGLDAVQCLRRCTTVTNEWVYTEGSGPYKDRLAPRLIKERTVPVSHKHLDEIVNPQPEALKVYQNLLAWIDEVDLASQLGQPRPTFKTADGDPIFPDDDRKWWLTDVQKRKPDEQAPGDDDGPVSEVDADKDDTDDDDPTSDEGDYQDDVGDLSRQTERQF